MKVVIFVSLGAFLLFAGCQNTELQQCRQDNQQLNAKIADLENQIIEEQDVSMRMLGDFLDEGNKTVKELDAVKAQMMVKDRQISSLQNQISDLNAKQLDDQKTIDSLNEQLKKAQAEKQTAINQTQVQIEKEKSVPAAPLPQPLTPPPVAESAKPLQPVEQPPPAAPVQSATSAPEDAPK